ncbi:GntP family permease [Herbaspirillum sp. SJZ099]|uniref:GntP family permease n=1 Tax=Herbaspirillum sp. SJZ099 TaxID=2572916 RepID=UPI0011A871E2|nr:GntP family permease [Herbaspirillum sp. SJZ099]TWC68140.1 H+/gluconate symporter-like permease [Herbaspirillum sp. SJZ099]
MALLAIVAALALLMWAAYRGWSILVLAQLAALLAVLLSGQPLMANWTITFMGGAASFISHYFLLFLLGALFGKLMDDSGSLKTIADFMTARLGSGRAVLAVVLAGALVTYGGVSLFVAFFVLAPMAHALFRAGNVPPHLMPAAILLGTSTFTMTALPGTPAIQNAIPMPFFKTTPFAAPGLSLLAAGVMLAFGLWWLGMAERRARRRGLAYAADRNDSHDSAVETPLVRERATAAREFDPAELHRGSHASQPPGIGAAVLPLCVVVAGNLLISLVVLPRLDGSYLAAPRWGGTTLAEAGGVWAVLIALGAAISCLLLLHWRRIGSVRNSVAAGANAAALPVLSVASLVGFGSVVAALPAFAMVRDWVLGIDGGPLVSLAVATNVLAALTGSASGGLTIALDALSGAYLNLAHATGLDPALLHRISVMSAGTLDSLPHNGAVVSLLAVCGVTHKEGYPDMVMVGIVGPVLALVVTIFLGSVWGAF